MKLPNIVAFLAAIACVALIGLLIRTQDELATSQAALASLKSSNAELTAKVDELERNKVDDALMKRLLADQREAIKLRGEVTTLKKSLASAESAAAAANAAAQKAKSQNANAAGNNEPAENPYARILGHKAQAIMPVGHGLIMGAGQTAPGKQGFAMAIPTIDPNNPGVVTVSGKFFEISDEAAAKLNTGSLLPGANAHGILTPDQLAAFEKSARETPGTDILASPRVAVFSGREARVSATQLRQTPNGPVEFGPSMSLTPTLGADGATVDLVVDAKLTLPTDQSTTAAANH